MGVCIKLFEFREKSDDFHTVVAPKKRFFMTRCLYRAGVHKPGFAFDKLLFFSA